MEGTKRGNERSKTVRGKKSPLLGTIKLAGGAAAVQRETFLSLSLSLSLFFSLSLALLSLSPLSAFPLISSVFLRALLDAPLPRACLLSAVRVPARLLRASRSGLISSP